MQSDIEINNFISFGVVSNDGLTDITFTVNDGTMFNISGKGVPMLCVPLNQISGFVQNVLCPSNITIYYKKLSLIRSIIASTYLPQHFDAINGRTCSILVKALNSLLSSSEPFITEWYFGMYKQGSAEKQGKRLWASRYLMIVGCRLLVYRYPIKRKRGNLNIPLNVIDLTNARIDRKTDNIIRISTHREYEFRFPSSENISSWLIDLKSASSRGVSLFNTVTTDDIAIDSLTANSFIEESPIMEVEITKKMDQHRPAPLDLSSPVLQSAEVIEEPKASKRPVISKKAGTEENRHNTTLHPLPSYIGSDSFSERVVKSNKKEIKRKNSNDSITLSIFSWGSNVVGQLGLEKKDEAFVVPTKVSCLSSPNLFPVLVSAGAAHCLCLSDEGELFSWGCGDNGQLGQGAFVLRCDKPTAITSLKKIVIVSIASGGNHCICLSSSGLVFAWGQGLYGQLGLGLDTDISFEPTLINKLRGIDISNIFCGQNHTIFLSNSGAVYACGNGYYGQLGLEQDIDYFSPMQINVLSSQVISQVACGETFTLFVSSTNTLIVTGMLEAVEEVFDAHRLQLAVPHIVPFDGTIKKIAAGTRFALLLATDPNTPTVGTGNEQTRVYFWRADESKKDRLSTPVLVPFLSDKHITDIVCGASHCIAYSSTLAKAYSWGSNYFGELGVGNMDEMLQPTEMVVPSAEKFIQISCGNAFSVGMSLPLSSQGQKTFIPKPKMFGILDNYSRNLLNDVVFSDSDSDCIECDTITSKPDSLSSISIVADSLDGLPNKTPFLPTPMQQTVETESSQSDSLYNSEVVNRQDRFTFNTLETMRSQAEMSIGSLEMMSVATKG